MDRELESLRRLCRSQGVQAGFTDAFGRRRRASREALRAVLRALGIDVDGSRGASDAARAERQARWRRAIEPVLVAAPGRELIVTVRMPVSDEGRRFAIRVGRSRGKADRVFSARARDLERVGGDRIEGRAFGAYRTAVPGPETIGYHRLRLEAGGARHDATVLVPPPVERRDAGRGWGVFVPLYSLRSPRSWGTADLSDLGELARWVAGLGGETVSTLPLLASFLDVPFAPSPYSPASRLFWNELYLDAERLVASSGDRAAADRLRSESFRRELAELRSARWVDYRRAMRLKRSILEPLAESFFRAPSPSRESFERDAGRRELLRYARFRAATEGTGRPWPEWPKRMRDGRIRPTDVDPRAERYHAWVQWSMRSQLAELAATLRERGPGLYLDLPLGVHPDGYDVWRNPGLFARGASAGAPPDPFFVRGQDWGFPPVHPARSREEGHRYWIDCVRNHTRFAGVLRVDHVMSLHRLFWVPSGFPARQGVYVRYPAEELYAILRIEALGHRTTVVGEDLGTVPGYVRPAMRRHGVRRLYAMQFEIGTGDRRPTTSIPPDSTATLNTHDMPTFRGFWRGLDIDDRLDLGLLDARGAAAERRRRRLQRRTLLAELQRRGHLGHKGTREQAALYGTLRMLGAGPAETVMVGLEDLWLEHRPHNVPGTVDERPNWKRRASRPLDRIVRSRGLARVLGELDRARRKGSAAE